MPTIAELRKAKIQALGDLTKETHILIGVAESHPDIMAEIKRQRDEYLKNGWTDPDSLGRSIVNYIGGLDKGHSAIGAILANFLSDVQYEPVGRYFQDY